MAQLSLTGTSWDILTVISHEFDSDSDMNNGKDSGGSKVLIDPTGQMNLVNKSQRAAHVPRIQSLRILQGWQFFSIIHLGGFLTL